MEYNFNIKSGNKSPILQVTSWTDKFNQPYVDWIRDGFSPSFAIFRRCPEPNWIPVSHFGDAGNYHNTNYYY